MHNVSEIPKDTSYPASFWKYNLFSDKTRNAPLSWNLVALYLVISCRISSRELSI